MMTVEELAELVQKMRTKQNDYFRKGRKPSDLQESRDLERQVDATVAGILDRPEPDLFTAAANRRA